MGNVKIATAIRDDDEEFGEYRVCSECRHLFWSQWDENDTPNFECPYCDSNFTELIGFASDGDLDMKKIWANHPEDHPIIGNDEFQFTDFSESN